jgi:hypothetical protein
LEVEKKTKNKMDEREKKTKTYQGTNSRWPIAKPIFYI